MAATVSHVPLNENNVVVDGFEWLSENYDDDPKDELDEVMFLRQKFEETHNWNCNMIWWKTGMDKNKHIRTT